MSLSSTKTKEISLSFVSKNKVFMLIVILKILFLFQFIVHMKDDSISCFVKLPDQEVGADDEGYFSTVDNLIETGEYFYEGVNSGYKMYAPRVPGLSLTYLIFRSFFSKSLAINCLIIFQSSLFLLALYFFSKELIGNKAPLKSNLLFVFIFGLDSYLSFYNNVPYLAESITVSIVFFIILLLRKLQFKIEKSKIFLIGILTAFSFFYKVSNIIFFISLFIYLSYLFYRSKKSIKTILIYYLIFISPFIFLESIWAIRNKHKTGKIILLQEITGNNNFNIMTENESVFHSAVNFCKSFGGDWTSWNPNSSIAWFSTEEYLNHMNFKRPKEDVFPHHISSDKIKIEKLKLARSLWWESLDTTNSYSNICNAKQKSINIFNNLKKENYSKHPFLFHIGSRFIYTFNLLLESSTYYFPYSYQSANVFEKGIKILSRLIYYIVMIIPIFFLPIYIFIDKNSLPLIVFFCYLSSGLLIFLYCFLFRTSEFRYNHAVYLFFMIISFYILNNFSQIKKQILRQ